CCLHAALPISGLWPGRVDTRHRSGSCIRSGSRTVSRTLAAFFLLFVLIGAAAAETTASDAPSSPSADDVGKWLVKAANAVRTGTYRGVMVYLRQNELDTLRVVHRFHDDVEHGRRVAVSGRPRESMRPAGRVS